MRKQCKRKRILKYQKRKANKMQAEILSFDEVLDSIKMGDIENIYVVNFFGKWVQNLLNVGVRALVKDDMKYQIFIQTELDGE